VLVVGATGTSKTITINTKLTVGLNREVYQPIPITFSAQTSANQTQDIVDAKLDRRSKGIFGPPLLKRFVVEGEHSGEQLDVRAALRKLCLGLGVSLSKSTKTYMHPHNHTNKIMMTSIKQRRR
jgi:hypothetical protein